MKCLKLQKQKSQFDGKSFAFEERKDDKKRMGCKDTPNLSVNMAWLKKMNIIDCILPCEDMKHQSENPVRAKEV